ncbi:hypothetical protein NDU88_006633 [Pleurodeles waltl]|uniref:Uncharacterized protein n=1 Tax=Pleurodeles waltl TaxID=8319 RepID=A0AAV7MCT5_PLEWA|nr:hypothetical protein NDU88_006633 [Pleurodeles waltl]
MAPKTIRNYGDKSVGARTTRIGRDKRETVGLSKRLASMTVRQIRQRKSAKLRSDSQECHENAASMSGRTLRWDYSGISLADTRTTGNQAPANDRKESDMGASAGDSDNLANTHVNCTEAGILQSIYNSIKELQTETRIESRRARIATKKLQGSVRKVAKSCMEIEAKLCSMEDRIVAVEEDMDTLKEQSAARDGQMTDVMWKMEDLENRQRRNNLRFLGRKQYTRHIWLTF